MILGLDGVEIGLIIVFMCLFCGILSGFPVAFAIGGAGLISFAIIAALDSAGLLIHYAIDTSSQVYMDLVHSGIKPDTVSVFRYPDLPRVAEAVFASGWETALNRNISFIVNRMNERVLAGQSIETLLAVLMFVLMGITLERSKIANDLLTTMARVFGPLPGGLAVSVVVVGAFLAASTGIVGATVVTMGLLSLPTMLRTGCWPELSPGGYCGRWHVGSDYSAVDCNCFAWHACWRFIFSCARSARPSCWVHGCFDVFGRTGRGFGWNAVSGGFAAGHHAGISIRRICLWVRAAKSKQSSSSGDGRGIRGKNFIV